MYSDSLFSGQSIKKIPFKYDEESFSLKFTFCSVSPRY